MQQRLTTAFSAALLTLSATMLGACGGGSGSSGSGTSSSSTVSGVVTDPAIRGAQVRLSDASGNALAAIVISADDGSFRFRNIRQSLLDNAVISASGGTDTRTGTDFTGITLQAVYQPSAGLFVSPLTTLIVHEMNTNSTDYASAAATVASLTGLTADQLDDDPTSNTAVQKISLQLTMLASALRAADGFSSAYGLIAAHGTDWDAISTEVQAEEFSASIKSRVAELVGELNAIDSIDSNLSAEAALTAANRLSFVNGTSRFLQQSLGYTSSGADADARIEALAGAIWTANGGQGIPSDSASFANLIRYVFNTYNISSSDLENSAWTVPAAISSDERIRSIAQLNVIDHTIALTSEDLLQTPDAKREYFYASDLSPYYRAQRIFDGVLDDTVTDPVYVSLAKAMASNNRPDELNVIVNTQIANPAEQADAAQNAADVFIAQGNTTLALQYLDLAWAIYEPVIEAIDIANITKDQANFLQQLAGSYNDAGETTKANEVLAPLTAYMATVSGTYSTTYSQIVTAFNLQAEALTAEAEENDLSATTVSNAVQTLNILAQLADGLGANGTTICYMYKGSTYVSLADYYRRLQMPAQVSTFIDKFETLRTSSDCANTAAKTDVYVDDLVDEYLYIDDLDGYNALVATMTSSTTTADAALLLVQAFEQAKNGETAAAIARITDAYNGATASGAASQVQWLTNVGINRGTPYLAVLLFNAGYTNEGTLVLDKAWEIAAGSVYNSSTNLSSMTAFWWGCPKVAQLTYDFVDQTLGQQRMQQCVTIADLYINGGNAKAAYYAFTHLINGLLLTNNGDLAVERFAYVNGIIENLADADYITAARYILNYALPSGIMEAGLSFADVSALQTTQMTKLNNLIAAASTENLRKAVPTSAAKIADSYVEIANGLQNRTIKTGLTDAELADKIRSMRNAVATVVSTAQPTAEALTTASNIASAFETFASMLSNARLYDNALALLDLDLFSNSDANALRTIIAKAMMAEDDFTGSDILARDFDLDGLPDFFEANASASAISASGITLDTDSDNDGTDDDADSTPFYCESCAY